ncbi:hypothetical protein CCMSSC00406_0009444 [Pleurotus cornucopiae]|uniref:Uncharacterized protein n=1 Tax=Pleurotus cornucopiae TaxID=5321 RepID=A0ACB7J1T3_PLECO|nr:hypothetical protein CCMSSC00406_0009444 [Pleurotus cornucopiae]
MATRMNTTQPAPNTTNAANSLCDYCRQKPKFGGYQYCSKTCAKQIATLCNQCHKKPKFPNFEYCGKNCAAAAATNGPVPTRNTLTTAGPGSFPSKRGKPSTKGPPNSSNAAITINPAQIARTSYFRAAWISLLTLLLPLLELVAQQMPQVQALLATAAAGAAGAALASAVGVGGGPGPGPAPRPSNVPMAQSQPRGNQPIPSVPAAAAPRAPAKASVNNPFINNPNTKASAMPTMPALDPDDEDSDSDMDPDEMDDLPECLLPGCEKSVHVDANGAKASEYCSKKHREQVTVLRRVFYSG